MGRTGVAGGLGGGCAVGASGARELRILGRLAGEVTKKRGWQGWRGSSFFLKRFGENLSAKTYLRTEIISKTCYPTLPFTEIISKTCYPTLPLGQHLHFAILAMPLPESLPPT